MESVATAEARLWIDSLVGETPVGNAADRIALEYAGRDQAQTSQGK
jgi:hypothetical protein